MPGTSVHHAAHFVRTPFLPSSSRRGGAAGDGVVAPTRLARQRE